MITFSIVSHNQIDLCIHAIKSIYKHIPDSKIILTINVDENITSVATINVIDDAGDTASWSISGEDASLFNISENGELTFKSAPDFETPLGGANDDSDIESGINDGTIVIESRESFQLKEYGKVVGYAQINSSGQFFPAKLHPFDQTNYGIFSTI